MKKKMMVLAALVLAVVVSAYSVSGTYAKYTSDVTKSGTATVAKWAFDTDNTATNFTIDLNGTIDPSTLVADRIAPGTEGSFTIALSNANTEVGVDVSGGLKDSENVPTNLKFYSDASRTNEINISSKTLTGYLAPNAASSDLTIYWKWAYNTTNGDTADTTDGKAGKTMTVKFAITGTQTEPSSTAKSGTFTWN